MNSAMSSKFSAIFFVLLMVIESSIVGAWLSKRSNGSLVDKITVEILKFCYPNQMNPLVVAGKFENFYNEILQDPEPIPILLIEDNTEIKQIRHQHRRLETFVIRADTPEELKLSFKLLKQLNQWNIEATFLIATVDDENCQNAMEFLKVAWEMNLLSSIFACDSMMDNEVMLYTYNPYTNRAPAPWKREDSQGPGDRWTLYSQPYIEDHKMCKSLDFDKTKYLDGFEIRAIANGETGEPWVAEKEYDLESINTMIRYDRGQYLIAIFSTLNVTPVIRYDLNTYDTKTMAKSVEHGNQILLNAYPMGLGHKFGASGTYPPIRAIMGMITSHRDFLSPVEKISRFFSLNLLFMIGFVLIITFIALTLYKKQGYKSASFEILRLIVNTSFLNQISTVAMRIYLIPVFFLFLIVNATFTGNFSAFLTKPELRRDAENIDDIRKLQYDVFGTSAARAITLAADWPDQYYHVTQHLNCSWAVLNDSQAVCISPVTYLIPTAISSHLHFRLIETRVMQFINYWVQDDWPLAKRFNDISFKLVDSGLIGYWTDQAIKRPMEKLDAYTAAEESPQIRKIQFEDIKFAFTLLIVGLVCSTIVFIIEILSKASLRDFKLKTNYFQQIARNVHAWTK